MGTYTVVAGGKPHTFAITGTTPSPNEIKGMRGWLARNAAPAAAPPPPEGGTGFFPAVESGFHGAVGSLYSAGEGLANLLPDDIGQGVEDWMASGAQLEGERAQAALPNPMTFDKVSGVGDFLQFGAESLGQAVPSTVGMAAGAVGAAMLAPAAPIVAGLAGAAAISYPMRFGSYVERQKEESGEITSVGGAALAAIPGTLAEAVVTRFMFGLGPLAKTVPKKNLTAKATRVLTHVIESAGAEAAQETSDAILERLQAGLPIDDEEAYQEYTNAAAAAAIAGGAFGVFGSGNRARKNVPSPPPESDNLLQKDAVPPSGIPSLLQLTYQPNTIYGGKPGDQLDNSLGGTVGTGDGRFGISSGRPGGVVESGLGAGNKTIRGEGEVSRILPPTSRTFQQEIIPPRVFDNVPQPISRSKKDIGPQIGRAKSPPFSEEQYQAALEYVKASKQGDWPGIRQATGLTTKNSTELRDAMVERGDLTKKNDKWPISDKLLATTTPLEAAKPPSTFTLATKPVVVNEQPATAVVQRELGPKGEIKSESTVDVLASPAEAATSMAAIKASQAIQEPAAQPTPEALATNWPGRVARLEQLKATPPPEAPTNAPSTYNKEQVYNKPEERLSDPPLEAAILYNGEVFRGTEHADALDHIITKYGKNSIDEIDSNVDNLVFGQINNQDQFEPHSGDVNKKSTASLSERYELARTAPETSAAPNSEPVPLTEGRRAAVKIGREIFTGQSHADALEKAIVKFGEDSAEVAAFADNPEAAIGTWADKAGTTSMGMKHPAGFHSIGISGDDNQAVRGRLANLTPSPAASTQPASPEGIREDLEPPDYLRRYSRGEPDKTTAWVDRINTAIKSPDVEVQFPRLLDELQNDTSLSAADLVKIATNTAWKPRKPTKAEALRAIGTRYQNVALSLAQGRATGGRSAASLGEPVTQTTPRELPNPEALARAQRVLRSRLNAIGLGNVGLKIADKIINRGVEVEGEYDFIDKTINLASNTHDRGLSAAEIVGTFNHEIVHALRDLSLFTDKEWSTLTKWAEDRPEAKWIDTSYADFTKEAILEEKVADLFKKWMDGSIQVAGAPQSFFRRILNFLQSLIGLAGDPDVRAIFDSIDQGRLAKRKTPELTAEQTLSIEPVPSRGNPNDSQDPSNLLNSPDSNPPSSQNAEGQVGASIPLGQRVPKTPENIAQNITYTATSKYITKKLGKLGVKGAEHKVQGFIDYMQDSMHSLAELVDWVKAHGGTIADASDTYLLADLMNSIAGKQIEANLRDGGIYSNLLDGVVAIKATEADTQSLSQFNPAAAKYMGDDLFKNSSPSHRLAALYLYAKGVPGRNARMEKAGEVDKDGTNNVGPLGSGISNEDAASIMGWFQRFNKLPLILRMETLARAVVADYAERIRKESGLIASDTQSAEEFHVPMSGHLMEDIDVEDATDDSTRTGLGDIRGKESKSPVGRKTMAGDIISNIINVHKTAVIRGERNKVLQSFGKMVRDNVKMMEGVVDEVRGPLTKPAMVDGKIKYVNDLNRDNILTYKENGKEVSFRIHNDRLAAAMKNDILNHDSLKKIIDVMTWVNNRLRDVSTTYNPAFFLVNFTKDIFTAAVNITQYEDLGGVEGLTKDFMKNIKRSFLILRSHERGGSRIDQEFSDFRDEMEKHGGFIGQYGRRSLEDTIRSVHNKVREDLSGGSNMALATAKKAFMAIKDLVEDYNTVFENATRLSVYVALRKKGFSAPRAAQAARNATVNFERGGRGKTLMNSTYLFFNASIQGTMAVLSAGARSKKVRRIMGGIVVAGVMQDFINSLLSPEDEDGNLLYDNISDWQLEHNLIFVDPSGLSPSGFIMIPLPYGFSAFWNTGRASMKMVRGGASVGQTISSVAAGVVDSFNPVGGTNHFLNFVAPTVLDPFIDVARNEDFANRPIAPENSPFGVQRPAHQLYWGNTSPLYKTPARWLSEATGGIGSMPGVVEWSPSVMQFWLEYVFGGVGAFGRQTFDLGTSGVEALATGSWDVEVSDIPIVRRFVGTVGRRNDTERFTVNSDHVLSVRKSIADAIKNGDRSTATEVMKRYPDEYRMSSQINNLNNQHSKIGQRIREIEKNVSLSAAAKRDIIEQLRKQQDTIVDMANKIMSGL